MIGNADPVFMRQCLVRHIANLDAHLINLWLDQWEKRHPKDTKLREEVRVAYLGKRR